MNEKIDFLAIGDIVNDDFIELDEKYASVECDTDGRPCKLTMNMGDKLPYKNRELVMAVGNSPNAAVSAKRLGLNSALMTHVGDDELGEKTLSKLRDEGVSTDFITVERGASTNYHFVLRYGAERTILIKHFDYSYNLSKQIEGKPTPSWIYFSSVGENSLEYHYDIADWVKSAGIKMAFQPGSFQIGLGYEKLKDIYENTEIFFLNVEEAESVLNPVLGQNVVADKKSDLSRKDFVKFLMTEFKKLGPSIVCVTDGPNGAYACDETGRTWYAPIYPDIAPPIDRTGAGDSFSSTFVSAIISGEPVERALLWGPINSMNVVQHVGAQKGLLSREKLLEYLNDAPDYYVAEEI